MIKSGKTYDETEAFKVTPHPPKPNACSTSKNKPKPSASNSSPPRNSKSSYSGVSDPDAARCDDKN